MAHATRSEQREITTIVFGFIGGCESERVVGLQNGGPRVRKERVPDLGGENPKSEPRPSVSWQAPICKKTVR